MSGWADFWSRHAHFDHEFRAADKPDAVRKMVQALMRDKGFDAKEVEAAAAAILKREMLGSTGIGRGVALPHTKFDRVTKLLIGWFYANPPIAFDTLDGDPAVVLVCFISPSDRIGDHLRTCEAVSRALRALDPLTRGTPASLDEWRGWVVGPAQQLPGLPPVD
jgi:PTS system fructose-specific IIA component/PTS system nitrogen regulatory IIA component